MSFKKGDPKPPGSGMQKGQKSEKVRRVYMLAERLKEEHFDVAQKLMESYKANNVPMMEVLIKLLRYLCAPYKDKSEANQENGSESTMTSDIPLTDIIEGVVRATQVKR